VTHLVRVASGALPTKQVEATSLVYRLAALPIANRLLLHVTPRSLVADGVDSAILHKDIMTDEMIDRYWDFIRMEGTRRATIARSRIRDNRIRDEIPKIKTPTLILCGDGDRTIPVEAAYAFHAAIAGSKLIVYPNTGHIPQEEVADQSATDVRAFLSAYARTPGR
jgi:pimeloyl-ACP methyl ester carboxylesterase